MTSVAYLPAAPTTALPGGAGFGPVEEDAKPRYFEQGAGPREDRSRPRGSPDCRWRGKRRHQLVATQSRRACPQNPASQRLGLTRGSGVQARGGEGARSPHPARWGSPASPAGGRGSKGASPCRRAGPPRRPPYSQLRPVCFAIASICRPSASCICCAWASASSFPGRRHPRRAVALALPRRRATPDLRCELDVWSPAGNRNFRMIFALRYSNGNGGTPGGPRDAGKAAVDLRRRARVWTVR